MKTTTTERYAICTLCSGHGRETDYSAPASTAGPVTRACRLCGGSGQVLIERTITTEGTATAVARGNPYDLGDGDKGFAAIRKAGIR